MTIEVDFISLPQASVRKMSIYLAPGESDNLRNILKVVSEKARMDFLLNRDQYIFMVNSVVVIPGMDHAIVQDGDMLTIMPQISGG